MFNFQSNPKSQFPKIGHWQLVIGYSQKGFSLLELTVVMAITAMLATLVLVNFASIRTQQETHAASNEMISKLREIQNNILSGKIVNGTDAADAYEITFSSPGSSYAISYDVDGTITPSETVNLSKNMEISMLTVGGIAKTPTTVRMTAPYGAITIDGSAYQNLQIELNHKTAGRTRTVRVDGVSGRIGLQ